MMIQVFIGEDTQKARKEAKEIFERAKTEYPDALISVFDDVSFDPDTARDAFASENLFGGINILYFDGVLDDPFGESFYRNTIQDTTHLVLIREKFIPKDLLVFFQRIAQIKDFSLSKKIEKCDNGFAIADAVGARDKKRAWVEFEKLRRHGAVMEEVHGTIFWAFKSMHLALVLPKADALATGMKEFTYRNYYGFAKKYLKKELEEKLNELKDMYHHGHRGEGELEVLIEQFLLRL